MLLSEGRIQDWASAVDFIRHSWKTNRETQVDYNLEFVNSLLQYPGDGPVLAPAYYDNGALIALVAGFPRSVRLQDQVRKLLLMSFFTVAPAYRGQGYGRAVWANCLRMAKSAGYDGVLHYCVDGNPSNAVTVAAAESEGFKAHRVFTIKYLMRLLRPSGAPASDPEELDAQLLLNAAESLAPPPLSRVWSTAEAEWQMSSYGRLFSADVNGGALTGYVLNLLDAGHTPCFFIEDVLWHRLAPEARPVLLDRFLGRASQIASLAVLPMLEYSDLSPFRAAGFRRSPRLLHAYLTLWHAQPDLQEFQSMYMDIL
jgi:GNAT superfamily N-acetyltransferase